MGNAGERGTMAARMGDTRAAFDGLLDGTPFGVEIFNEDGHCIGCNRAFRELFGGTVSTDYNVLSDPRVKSAGALPAIQRAFAGDTARVEATWHQLPRTTSKRGAAARSVIETVVFPVRDAAGNVTHVVAQHQNVADAVSREERYRLAVEAAPNAMVMIDAQRRIVMVNGQAERLFGYTRKEMLGQLVELLVPERFRAKHPADVATFMRNPATRAMGAGRDLYGVRKDGSEVPIEIGLNPLDTPEGPCVLAAIVDITERQRLKREQDQMQERFRLAVEAAPNAMIMVNAAGTILMVNKQTERMFGYERSELIGQLVEILVPERFRANHPDERASFMANPHVRSMGAGRELFGLRKDGTEVPIEIGLNPLDTPDGLCVLAAVIDISARKRMDEEQRELQHRMQHAQKLESLGVLAGGIAHDFNNLLMAIMGNADLALMRMSNESPARVNVEHIDTAAKRAADLTRQMLAYSGKGKFQLLQINLSKAVEEMAHLLQVSVSKKAVLRYNFAPNLPTIEADPAQVSQIVMNLITNASDAIGEKSGVITISTGITHLDEDYLKTCVLDDIKEGPYAYVEVSDTGIGMSAETRERIFEPFFTTKFTGRGLGLAAIMGIVRGHKGTVRVYSELGRGTTFKVLFPISGKAVQPNNAPEGDWEGSGTVLVIDDEESVRGVSRMILEEFGFSVLTAEDGLRGLDTYRAHADGIRLVLLDMTMPHLNGEETFRELRRIKPEVKVILSSGFSEQEATLQFAGKGLAGFLQKPYRAVQLLEAVRAVLDPKG